MILLGAFRKFDLNQNPLAAVFIFSGEWEALMLRKRKVGRPLEKDILARGTFHFKRGRSRKLEFYADRFTLQIIQTGLAERLLIRQGEFKVLFTVGEGSYELNLASTTLIQGNTVSIDTFCLNLEGGE